MNNLTKHCRYLEHFACATQKWNFNLYKIEPQMGKLVAKTWVSHQGCGGWEEKKRVKHEHTPMRMKN
jgi:hypothetical protein